MVAQTDNKMLYEYTQKANQKYYPPKKIINFKEADMGICGDQKMQQRMKDGGSVILISGGKEEYIYCKCRTI